MSTAEFEIITVDDRLAQIEPQWWDLWRSVPDALPFLSPAWLIPWWRHFAPGALFTLAALEGDRLVGLAPGYIEDGPLGRRILPLGISLSDHLDVLIDPDCPEEALAALSAAAESRSGDWDLWELEELLPGAAALRLPLPAGCADQLQDQSACPLLHVSHNASEPFRFPLKKRRNIQLARNRCERRGPLRISRAEGPEASDALEHLLRLHQARWHLRGEPGVMGSGAVQAFQREAVPRLQDAGLLRLYTLSIGDTVAAVYYALVSGSRAYAYLTGFDPDYDKESPGVLLMAHVIEEAVAAGCREIDFLRGQEPYKYGWGAVDRWNVKRSIRHAANA
jgi:CelD/BcsL family acetyltransferase involved in cellulose biosynthesis